MTEFLLIIFGLTLGGLVAWLWASAKTRASLANTVADLEGQARAAEGVRDELRQQIEHRDREILSLRSNLEGEQKARTEAQTRLEAAQQSLQEQKNLLEEAKNKFTEVFEALSSEALKSNNQSFLQLAKESLKAIVNEAKGDIGKRQEAIDSLINPLKDALQRYEEQIRAIEEKRDQAYGGLKEQLRLVNATQQQLQRETGNLVTALRRPDVRGRWGEVTLHRVVELAGMSEHCDYLEQTSVDSEDGRIKPDMIVQLPAGREIVIDAKVPLDAYLDALSASSEEKRSAAMLRHAQQIRGHMHRLAAKSYWKQFERAPEFVVMFIPGESFFAAAAERDRSLIEDGMAKQVVLATPTTLIALLRAVAYGWREERIAESAKAISDLGKQLYDRLRILAEHLNDIGSSLNKAIAAHNRAAGSLESRVFPSARRFKDLGAAAGEEIPVIESVDHIAREVNLTESD